MILNSDKYFKSKKYMDMFKVSQLSSPNMTVHINSGSIIVNNRILNFSEQDTDIITAPRIGTRLVVLSINNNGEIVYTYGVQSTEEKAIPKLPEDCFHLCVIELNASTEYIVDDMIYDLRQMFNFSYVNEKCCVYRCGMESDFSFTKEDREILRKYYDKVEALSQEIDKLRLMFNPQKEYRVLSDGGIEYTIRFRDDGTPYVTRTDGYIDPPNEDDKHKDYKFVYCSNVVNVVNDSSENFIQVGVKIRSFDNMNRNIPCTLFIRCNDTTIHSSNHRPHYQENEFKVENLEITKSGFYERFNFKFHNSGAHQLSLLLYNNETQELIDKASIKYEVAFRKQNID